MSKGVYSVANLRRNLADVLHDAKYNKGRTLVTSRNKAIAYIVPIEDVKYMELLERILEIVEENKK